jgi:hemolysin activation/secretion protein
MVNNFSITLAASLISMSCMDILKDACFQKAEAKIPNLPILPEPGHKPEPLKPKNSPLDITPVKPIPPPQDKISKVWVKKIQYIGNTAISSKEINAAISMYLGREITNQDLEAICSKIQLLYISKGYVNSGAQFKRSDNLSFDPQSATLNIRIIEGGLIGIDIEGAKGLKKYISNNLGVNTESALNEKTLTKHLQILQDDPLINQISGTLNPGTPYDPLNGARLKISVIPNKPYNGEIFSNNTQSSGSGTFGRGFNFTLLNPLHIGDKIDLSYINTSSSNAVQVKYLFPVISNNTKIHFTYSFGSNVIIEKPFDSLDITGVSHIFETGIEHIIFQNINENSRSTFKIGLDFKYQTSENTLLGLPYQIADGDTLSGQQQTSVLSFNQSWSYRDAIQAVFLRSDLLLGVDINSSTDPFFNNGQFLGFRGEAYWLHKLPWGLKATSRLQMQFVDRPVVSSEKFAAGGINSVRAEPTNVFLADDGVLISFQIDKSIFSTKSCELNAFIFMDAAYLWNISNIDNSSQTLAGPGIGLRFRLKNLSASISYAIPITSIPGIEKNTIQGNGVLMNISWIF